MLKKMQIKKFPLDEESDPELGFSCGHVLIAAIIKHQTGVVVPERTLVSEGHEFEQHLKSVYHEGLKTPDEGIDRTGIFGLMKKYGLGGISMQGAGIQTAKHFIKRDLPIMVASVYLTDEDHAFPDAVRGIENGKPVIYNTHYTAIIGIYPNTHRVKVADGEDPKRLKSFISYEELNKLRALNPFAPGWMAAFWKRDNPPYLGNIKGRRF